MDIYPAIDIKDGKCVRLQQGNYSAVTIYSEDPVKMAKRWKEQGAQWLHIVDLDGARKGAPSTQNLDVLRHILRQVGLPVQYGGGVRSAEIVERMLNIGVARVVVGTAAAKDATLAQGLFTVYGDKVAVGVDARDGFVAVEGWHQKVDESSVMYVKRMAALGAKRFIFTDIARDGMLEGVNLKALAEVASAVPFLPVIASGGVASLADLDSLAQLRTSLPNIDGVIIGKALYAGALTLPDALARARSLA